MHLPQRVNSPFQTIIEKLNDDRLSYTRLIIPEAHDSSINTDNSRAYETARKRKNEKST